MKHKVGKVSEFKEKNCKVIEIRGKMVSVFYVNGSFLAIDDACTHSGASLSDGTIENFEVECPWHGARFDLRTGRAISMPATEGVSSYKTSTSGNDVYVEIENEGS